MREVELKAVVDDLALRRRILEEAGASLSFEGRISDRRYDVESRALSGRDEVLRVRRYENAEGSRVFLDWKGPTEIRDMYKVREEITAPLEDFEAFSKILDRLGYQIVGEIDRDIAQYQVRGATVRFETYPRMDVLVEVEGSPETIEAAIEVVGMPRGVFSSDRLAAFVARFEGRTGVRAAISDREMAGDYQAR
jgi:predicted adenylyl cyclase CyaB